MAADPLNTYVRKFRHAKMAMENGFTNLAEILSKHGDGLVAQTLYRSEESVLYQNRRDFEKQFANIQFAGRARIMEQRDIALIDCLRRKGFDGTIQVFDARISAELTALGIEHDVITD